MTDSGTSFSYEAGELLRIVAATLETRGLQVRAESSASSRRLTVTWSGDGPYGSPDSEVIVEDDGYVEWRYWPAADHPVNPARIAGVIADILSADLSVARAGCGEDYASGSGVP
ncbi:MAG: hypothetical protein ABJB47_02380 [Actinomycetota bacterium]